MSFQEKQKVGLKFKNVEVVIAKYLIGKLQELLIRLQKIKTQFAQKPGTGNRANGKPFRANEFRQS